MKFWDTSILVPFLLSEKTSTLVRQLYEDDPEIIIWTLTPVEIFSACYRRICAGDLSDDALDDVRRRLVLLESAWSTIVQIDSVQEVAKRLLAVHSLTAADALQLAAAIIACNHQPTRLDFLSLDYNLNRAARREGFQVLSER
jgi:uncharacterized protein